MLLERRKKLRKREVGEKIQLILRDFLSFSLALFLSCSLLNKCQQLIHRQTPFKLSGLVADGVEQGLAVVGVEIYAVVLQNLVEQAATGMFADDESPLPTYVPGVKGFVGAGVF